MNVIELDNLTKRYGASRGVSDISFAVPEGTIVGFLGPNGAGKSTTMNMLIGYLKPTSGSAKIFGLDVVSQGLKTRKDIGFLAGETALDGGLAGWQQVEYFARLRKAYNKTYVEELARRLDADMTRKIKTLSRGNRQKIALITALAHKPKLLLLDEPTTGLDPLMQAEFNKILLEHKAAGNTVFISSHVLSEVEELCDRMLFIREGKLIADKTMSELALSAPKHVRILTSDKKLHTALSGRKDVSGFHTTDTVAEFEFSGMTPELIAVLAKHSFTDVSIAESDLEQSFIGYYEGKA